MKEIEMQKHECEDAPIRTGIHAGDDQTMGSGGATSGQTVGSGGATSGSASSQIYGSGT